MNDDQFEKMLRESWKPALPEAMRERVLRRARAELAPARPRQWWFSRAAWRRAFVCVGLLVVIASALSESARETRLEGMVGGRITGAKLMMASRMLMVGQSTAGLDLM